MDFNIEQFRECSKERQNEILKSIMMEDRQNGLKADFSVSPDGVTLIFPKPEQHFPSSKEYMGKKI